MSDLNQVAIDMYAEMKSLGDISVALGLPKSRVRKIILSSGLMRDRKEALRIVLDEGRIANKLRGRKRPYSDEVKMRVLRAAWEGRRKKAKGTRINSQGYVEFTMGENYGRREHTVLVEENIGRRLNKDECVHHIDGDKTNNALSNLQLMSFADHARLHRELEKSQGKERTRENGRFR